MRRSYALIKNPPGTAKTYRVRVRSYGLLNSNHGYLLAYIIQHKKVVYKQNYVVYHVTSNRKLMLLGVITCGKTCEMLGCFPT